MKDLRNNTGKLFISIWAVLIKNFKTVFRSKSSAFTIMLGPLIIMSLLVLAFNNSSFYDINIGVYSKTYSELSNSVIDKIEAKGYVVVKNDNSTDCIAGVKEGSLNACLIFSPNMQITNNANNTIEFHVDPARINIVDNIMSSINKEILKTSENISLSLTNVLVTQLTNTKDELNKRSELLNIINSNSNKIKETSGSLQSSANAIDLTVTYDSFNTVALRNEISKVNSSSNISSSDVQSLNTKLVTIETQINTTISQMLAAKTKITELSGNIATLPIAADNNIVQTTLLKDSIGKIVGNINNIAVTNPESIVSPIKTSVETIETEETHIGRFLSTFLVLIIMFVCVLLASNLVLSERMSNAYLRNAITPTPKSVFLIGAYLTSLIVIVFHLVVISLILKLIIGFSLETMLYAVIPLFIVASMFILLGITIGYFAKSQESASVVSLVIIAVALFLSNTILPLETIPLRLKEIILYNPFVVSEALLKKILILGFTYDKVITLITKLFIYNLVLLVLSYLGLKFAKSEIKR